jgi:hypothetical protein
MRTSPAFMEEAQSSRSKCPLPRKMWGRSPACPVTQIARGGENFQWQSACDGNGMTQEQDPNLPPPDPDPPIPEPPPPDPPEPGPDVIDPLNPEPLRI